MRTTCSPRLGPGKWRGCFLLRACSSSFSVFVLLAVSLVMLTFVVVVGGWGWGGVFLVFLFVCFEFVMPRTGPVRLVLLPLSMVL